MSKREKLLNKMRNKQIDWRIEDLIFVANYFGFKYRQPGTSHVTFSDGLHRITVPSHKPIKPVYIKQFIAMIDDSLKEGNANELH